MIIQKYQNLAIEVSVIQNKRSLANSRGEIEKALFLKDSFFSSAPAKVGFFPHFFPLTFIPKDSFHQCMTKSFFYHDFYEKLVFPYGFFWPRACEPSAFVSME